VAAGAGGVLAAAACIEIVLRLIGYGDVSHLGYGPRQNNLGMPELGYAGRPNVDGIQMREGYSHLVLNDLGFHDVNVPREKPAGTFRVAVVGNSFTMAVHVDRPDTYVSHLEKTLAACPALAGKHVEAINLGVDGYTTNQQYLLMKEFVWRYSPDFVVLQDAPGVEDPDRVSERVVSPRVVLDDDGTEHIDTSVMASRSYQARASLAFTLFQRLSDHSRFLQYVDDFRRKLDAKRKAAVKAEADQRQPAPPISVRGAEKAKLLRAIVGISRSHSTPLAFVLIPDGESMDPRTPNETPKTEDEIWWQQQGEDLGVPVVNAAPAAWKFAREHRVFLAGFGRMSGLGHLTRAGHAFFGRAFANEICGSMRR
jgi:hypothetical protein